MNYRNSSQKAEGVRLLEEWFDIDVARTLVSLGRDQEVIEQLCEVEELKATLGLKVKKGEWKWN